MSALKLDQIILGAGLVIRKTAADVYKFFKTNSSNVVNTPIEINNSGVVLDTPLALASPADGDSSLLLAPTSWVAGKIASLSKQIGNYSGVTLITHAITLDTTHSGKLLLLQGSSGYTIILPDPATITPGFTVSFYSTSSAAMTISRNLSNQSAYIYGDSTFGGTASFTLNTRTSIKLTWDGSNWICSNHPGSASFTANGYQKLPSGLILQWGKISNTNLVTNRHFSSNFPIAFPNSCLNVTCQIKYSNVDTIYSLYISDITLTAIWFLADNSTATPTSADVYYSAIGF